MQTKIDQLKILESQLTNGARVTCSRAGLHLDAIYALLKCFDSKTPSALEELQDQFSKLQHDSAILFEYLEMLRIVREMQNSKPQSQLRFVSLCPPFIS